MQILELLGSSAPTPAAINPGAASTNDAFTKHLDEIIGQRQAIKAEDAKRHKEDLSAGDDVADVEDARPEDDARLDDADEIEEAADREIKDSEDEVAAKSGDNNQTDNADAAAAPTADGVIGALVSAAAKTDVSDNSDVADVVVAAAVAVEADAVDGPDAALVTVVADTTKPVARKANDHAAFKDNANDQASVNASDNATPFALDPNGVGEEQVAMADASAVKEAAVSDADFSDDPALAAEVAVLAAAPAVQSEAPKAQDKAKSTTAVGNQGIAETKSAAPAADAVDAAAGPVTDPQLATGTDARQEAMRLAETLQNSANADNIFNRFAPGQSSATPVAQAGAAQANTQQPGNAAAKAPDALPLDANGKPPSVATQIPANQSVQAPQNAQNASTNAQPHTLPPSGNMDDSLLNALTQTRPAPQAAQAAQAATANGANGANAAAAAATRGSEAATLAGSNASPTTAAVGAVAETSTPNATQAAAAVRPATPPPPAQQTPQVQVAMQIAKAVQNGTDRISIRLNPAELGRIDIKLDVSQGGQVVATITVDRPETLEMLKADSRALEQALSDAGLDSDSENLSFNLRDQDADGNRLAQDENADGDELAAEMDDDAIEQALAQARRNGAANRALDINV